MKHVTLLFVCHEGRVLLAMKKRGFGAGKWNGAGGKLEPGETPLAAAVRETQEELGITPLEPRKIGEIDFYLADDPSFNHFTHIYMATAWHGEPHETEEMRPQWFAYHEVPWGEMWGDDKYWLPGALQGRRFRAMYKLDADDGIVDSSFSELAPGEDFTA